MDIHGFHGFHWNPLISWLAMESKVSHGFHRCAWIHGYSWIPWKSMESMNIHGIHGYPRIHGYPWVPNIAWISMAIHLGLRRSLYAQMQRGPKASRSVPSWPLEPSSMSWGGLLRRLIPQGAPGRAIYCVRYPVQNWNPDPAELQKRASVLTSEVRTPIF